MSGFSAACSSQMVVTTLVGKISNPVLKKDLPPADEVCDKS